MLKEEHKKLLNASNNNQNLAFLLEQYNTLEEIFKFCDSNSGVYKMISGDVNGLDLDTRYDTFKEVRNFLTDLTDQLPNFSLDSINELQTKLIEVYKNASNLIITYLLYNETSEIKKLEKYYPI